MLSAAVQFYKIEIASMLLFIIHDFDQQYEGIIIYNFSTKEFHAGWVRATSLKKVHKLRLQNEVGTRHFLSTFIP